MRIPLLLLLLLISWGCAQQGSPTGGPRDEDPPLVLESIPPNYSTRFESKKIEITFDEYIVLDNVNQQLVVSPPMEEKPEVKLRKKTLVITFEEDLKDSTTYTFNFGSAIKDLHEGNRLLNFEYVFSTGDVLDSLSVRGTLRYAEDLTEPDEPITIMLYSDLRDSVPLLDIPLYVGRSDDSGVFSVNNLKTGIYKVFALKDGNYNLLFDLPTEEIAFLDTSLVVDPEIARQLLEASDSTLTVTDSAVMVADSAVIVTDPAVMVADSAVMVADSAVMVADPAAMVPDSTLVSPDSSGVVRDSAVLINYNAIYIDLMLFTEDSEIQYLMDNSRDDRRLMRMVFAQPLTDSFNYRILTQPGEGQMNLLEHLSPGRDSLSLWIVDSLDYKKDTLMVEINYTVRDTTMQFITQTDTLRYIFRERPGKRKVKGAAIKEKLDVATIGQNKEQNLNSNLRFDLNVPLLAIHDSLISLYHIPDSVEVPVSFDAAADSLRPDRGWISLEWESFSSYRMVMLPGAVESIYDLEHDTVDVTFKTRDIEYYGTILLTMENVRNPVVVQLLSKEQLVREIRIEEAGLYTFTHMIPRDYSIKCIHDLNGNGRWDTGKYLEKRQPEAVEILPGTITVRSNWDHDVTMTLKK